MNPKRLVITILASVSLVVALAQPSTEEAEGELARAVELLEQATSYAFAYDITPTADATSNITGEGRVDFTSRTWHYTVQSDPSDPNADSSRDGEWIIADNTWYHNPGSGWTPGTMDFTNMGITFIIAPFASYSTLKMLGSEESFEEIHWVGRETVDDLEGDHYRFSLTDMPLYGTGTYDVWITKDGDTITRVILAVSPEDGLTNTVRYSNINEPVTIEVPQ